MLKPCGSDMTPMCMLIAMAGRGIVIMGSDFFLDDWRKLQMMSAASMGILFLSTVLIHESPRYLVATGKTEEAGVTTKQLQPASHLS